MRALLGCAIMILLIPLKKLELVPRVPQGVSLRAPGLARGTGACRNYSVCIVTVFEWACQVSPHILRKSAPLIGTSGWTYDGWRGPFYPPCERRGDWLRFYATRFPTTEINGSFYRTPTLQAVRAWRDHTPANFRFAWKASKFITHWKRLSEKCDNSLALMETRLSALAPKVAAVLFQLPPQFQKDRERLNSFLQMLPGQHHYTFEFRHRSWYDDDILELLRERDVALCISDHHDAPSPWLTSMSAAMGRQAIIATAIRAGRSIAGPMPLRPGSDSAERCSSISTMTRRPRRPKDARRLIMRLVRK
jgi:hypothetical protein